MAEANPIRDVYSAIADPTRRKMIRMLADAEELPLFELTAEFSMGRTAVSKHLVVLKEAKLVTDRKVGRETRYRLNPAPLRDIQDWLSYYERFWTNRMSVLGLLLAEEEQSGKDVSLDFAVKHSIEQVWAALTDADELAKWIYPNDFKPEVGHPFTFRGEPNQWWDGIIRCEVLEVETHNRLSYAWVSGGEDTIVTWTLTQAEDASTQLHLDQTGFRAEQAFNGAILGWQRMATQLEKVLTGR